MAWELNGQTAAVEQALAGGAPQSVGWFRFYFEDQRWEWSEQVQRMHGYEPGTVTPTTELVLAHKHADDRAKVATTINEMISDRRAFSTRHRIIDTAGAVHEVIVVGDQFCDDGGEVIGSHGFYVDVTAELTRESQDAITAKVAEIAERRGLIDQTKGMLMLVYSMDEAAAFNVLRSLSQVHNVKVGELAHQIARDFTELAANTGTSRVQFDQALLTAHLRAGESAGAAAG
jgi:ANTAR domain/PAS fold